MSEHKTIYTTTPDFLSIKQAPGYYYAERKGVDSVAVFLVTTDKKVLVRYQPLPQFDSERLFECPITGTMEPHKHPAQVAQIEALEEGGYPVEISSAIDLGGYIVGTQTNETCYCYAWDVTFIDPVVPEGDGSIHEAMSENAWLTFEQAMNCAEYSGLIIGLYRLREKGLL
jgi:8-oxo-dGTP diphosphatase